MKVTKSLVLLLIFALVLSACTSNKDKKEEAVTNGDDPAVVTEHGELVPEVRIFTSLLETNAVNYEASQMFKKEWNDLGISVSVEPLEFNTLIDRLYGDDMDYDAYTVGWSGRADRIDPDMFIHSIFHSVNAGPGGNNTSRYRSDAYDQLADAQRAEMNPEERRKIVFEAQEMLANDAPLLTLYARSLYHAYNKNRFDNMVVMAGEGIFNEWMPVQAKPLTNDKWLKIGSTQDLNTMNPLGAKSVYEWRNLRLIYDKLVRLNTEAKPTPAAATAWDVVDDTTIDVTLRQGMKFHDGKPVTVEDVKFSYDYFIDWKVGYFLSFTNPIESVEILDDQKVRFNLKQPYAPFVNVTLAQIPILPKHIWENLVDEQGLAHPDEYANLDAIGSGPFKFDHWRRGEELRMSKNPDFYENISIDGLIYVLFGQHEAVMTALETGDLDSNAEQFIPAHIEKSQTMNHLAVVNVPDIGYQYLSFNLDRKPFDDLSFRQAIAHTIDYDSILEIHLQGYGIRGGSGLVINEANEYWHNPNVDHREYDPALAREILKNAGYTWDSDGRLRFPVK